jgi:hypothetical protein
VSYEVSASCLAFHSSHVQVFAPAAADRSAEADEAATPITTAVATAIAKANSARALEIRNCLISTPSFRV